MVRLEYIGFCPYMLGRYKKKKIGTGLFDTRQKSIHTPLFFL